MRKHLLWIIRLSVFLYTCLLRVGPVDYRREYAEQTVQVFRRCCLDAYRARGIAGVLVLWPPLFSEALLGMLAERFSPERMCAMLPNMRRSIVMLFAAFVLFALAYLFLLRIIDPLPPFEVVALAHPEIGFAYTLLRSSANLACGSIFIGGLIILGTAGKQALTSRRLDLLALFGCALLVPLVFGLATIVLASLPHVVAIAPLIQIAYIGFSLLCLSGEIIVIVLIILRSEFSSRILRLALVLMGVTTLSMSISFLAIAFWLVRLWLAEPRFAASQGLDFAGLLHDPGGVWALLLLWV